MIKGCAKDKVGESRRESGRKRSVERSTQVEESKLRGKGGQEIIGGSKREMSNGGRDGKNTIFSDVHIKFNEKVIQMGEIARILQCVAKRCGEMNNGVERSWCWQIFIIVDVCHIWREIWNGRRVKRSKREVPQAGGEILN